MKPVIRHMWFLSILILPFFLITANAAILSTTSLTLVTGESATITLSKIKGKVRLNNSNTSIASATLSDKTITVTAKSVGITTLSIKDANSTQDVPVSVSPRMSVLPNSLILSNGQTASINVSDPSGPITLINSDYSKIDASLSGNTITVTGLELGNTILTVQDDKTLITVPVAVTTTTGGGSGTSENFALFAWNDLGMHCMDADYSVFSILPPFNNLHAHLVNKTTGEIVTSGVTLTYQSERDPNLGTINTSSFEKTNFWTYVKNFFGELPNDVGLTGNRTPSNAPQPLSYDNDTQMFKAEGIPITPYDDEKYNAEFKKNTYPLVRVVGRDMAGNELASARVVLPVSDEMSCKNCHASNTEDAAMPAIGWVTGETPEREYRLNILRLHDEKSGTTLYDQAMQSPPKPTLCASCHASNALPGSGIDAHKPLTESMHATHANVADPISSMKLDDTANRGACYQCHPGSQTRCLRGAMSASELQCQSCHGKMSHVGRAGRVGWLDQPNCQACHHDGKRELLAVDENGKVNQWADKRFATNPDTPAGFSLFRMSKGHGDLQCEACHGATHAEYASTPADPTLPPNHYNDNLLSLDTQGHAGTIGECNICHKSVPLTTSGGPHGMHTLGQTWVKEHHDMMPGDHDPTGCAYCHGADYRGSALSIVNTDRTFSMGERGSKSYSAGDAVSCYDCHNGPRG